MLLQKKISQNGGKKAEVNMTPLIDVSLVLVVMLMLATPFAFESSIGVRNTTRTAKAAEKESKQERVELYVASDDSVRVNKVMMARDQLTIFLPPLIQESSRRLVVVKCGHGISHGAFVDVLDKAKLSGAISIAVTDD